MLTDGVRTKSLIAMIVAWVSWAETSHTFCNFSCLLHREAVFIHISLCPRFTRHSPPCVCRASLQFIDPGSVVVGSVCLTVSSLYTLLAPRWGSLARLAPDWPWHGPQSGPPGPARGCGTQQFFEPGPGVGQLLPASIEIVRIVLYITYRDRDSYECTGKWRLHL